MNLSTRERCKAHTLAVRGGNRCLRDTHQDGLCYQHWMATHKIRKERVKKLTIKQQRDRLLEALKGLNYMEMPLDEASTLKKVIAECEGK